MPEVDPEEYYSMQEKALASELSTVFTFGKYRGRTYDAVLRENPAYLIWAHENVEWFVLSESLYAHAANRASIVAEHRREHQEDALLCEYGMTLHDLLYDLDFD